MNNMSIVVEVESYKKENTIVFSEAHGLAAVEQILVYSFGTVFKAIKDNDILIIITGKKTRHVSKKKTVFKVDVSMKEDFVAFGLNIQ